MDLWKLPMPSPIVPVPHHVARWIAYASWLRWLDALAAWVALVVVSALALPDGALSTDAVVAALALGLLAWAPGIRARWRPVSAVIAFRVSASLGPGDRAWWVHGRQADPVLVTGRHGLRVVIATANAAAEGFSVRRTRVVLVPADGA